MRPLQKEIIEVLHASPAIDPPEEVRRRIDFLKRYLTVSKAKGLVLGISGGQDSTLAGVFCRRAVDELSAEGNVVRFIAVRLPHGEQADEHDAQRALDFIDPQERLVFNIKATVDACSTEFHGATNAVLSDFARGNVKARMRMIAQYAVANDADLLVVGTDHAAEAITGFFTKYGDGGADVLPLTGLTKRQGRALLKHLGAPPEVYLKEPTADLLDLEPGQADEINLGITYDVIDDYLEGRDIPLSDAEAIELRYRRTQHKREAPATLYDTWWWSENTPEV